MADRAIRRNRSQGWKWAKLTGHQLEVELADRIKNEPDLGRELGSRILGRDVGSPNSVSGGGVAAERILDVFGNHTNGKPDIYLRWRDLPPVNISLKKSTSGQVFLTSVDRFVTGFRAQFNLLVPSRVVEMLHLFIGTDKERCEVAMRGRKYFGPLHRNQTTLQEEHQHRILGITLDQHFKEDWELSLNWMKSNASNIADFVFARGYAMHRKDYATHVWYLTLQDDVVEIDQIIPISEICTHADANSGRVAVGPRNGGSTIVFPFGFLQMHSPQGENQIQFHHQHHKISGLGNIG